MTSKISSALTLGEPPMVGQQVPVVVNAHPFGVAPPECTTSAESSKWSSLTGKSTWTHHFPSAAGHALPAPPCPLLYALLHELVIFDHARQWSP